MVQSLEDFGPVYGQVEGVLEASVPFALLPFVFYLHTKDGELLRLQVTDFHSNTWQTLRTIHELEELRDEVGIGGSWNEFLEYLRDAFMSDNVKLVLGGPANSVGGYGATSAKLVTQKAKGTPRVSISLEKLVGTSAKDIMGNIAVELVKDFKQRSDVLTAEQVCTSQLALALAAEKEKSQRLQQQIDAMSFMGKKRARNTASQFQYTLTSEIPDVSFTQPESKDLNSISSTQAPSDESKIKRGKPPVVRNKAHMAHARRAKQRGGQLADVDE